jgi:hypothetical protein
MFFAAHGELIEAAKMLLETTDNTSLFVVSAELSYQQSRRHRRSGGPSSQGLADVRAFDAVSDHILHMSDAIADGIVKQFPDEFGGATATTTTKR